MKDIFSIYSIQPRKTFSFRLHCWKCAFKIRTEPGKFTCVPHVIKSQMVFSCNMRVTWRNRLICLSQFNSLVKIFTSKIDIRLITKVFFMFVCITRWNLPVNFPVWPPWSNMTIMVCDSMNIVFLTHHYMIMAVSWHVCYVHSETWYDRGIVVMEDDSMIILWCLVTVVKIMVWTLNIQPAL